MKKLFIYYSNTGSGDLVAEYLKDKGLDTRKVIRKKKLPKSFFWQIMCGGFLAMTKHKDKIVDFDYNIDEYDEIIIGSPIWCGTISSPINTVLANIKLDNKKVSFVLYAGGGEAPDAVQRLNTEFKAEQIIVLKEPKKYPEELAKLNVL